MTADVKSHELLARYSSACGETGKSMGTNQKEWYERLTTRGDTFTRSTNCEMSSSLLGGASAMF